MNEYMPTTQQVEDGFTHEPEYEYANPVGYGAHVRANRRAFKRWLAEVERAAAEKALRGAALSGRFGTNAQSVLLELADSARAWNQGYLAASRDFMQNAPFENAAANPYRRNEGGRNAESS